MIKNLLKLTRRNFTEYVNIIFVNKDKSQTKVKAKIGDHILSVAHKNDIEIEGACDAQLACSTCHVILEEELYESMEEPDLREEDLLDMAYGLTPTSRLGCQVFVTKEFDGTKITLPQATRNFYVDGFTPKPHQLILLIKKEKILRILDLKNRKIFLQKIYYHQILKNQNQSEILSLACKPQIFDNIQLKFSQFITIYYCILSKQQIRKDFLVIIIKNSVINYICLIKSIAGKLMTEIFYLPIQIKKHYLKLFLLNQDCKILNLILISLSLLLKFI